MEESTSSDNAVNAGGDFFSVRVASLCSETTTNFDLYLRADSARDPVLYREKHLPFTTDVKIRLRDNKVEELYVPTDQTRQYRRYVEANLAGILQDENTKLEERSGVLYLSATGLVQDVLEDPRSGELGPRTRNLVGNTVNFVFTRSGAFESLLKVTSYDYYTYTHSVNVFVFSVALARYLGAGPQEVLDFGLGALLHDIGKCRIDPAIVNCPGRLNNTQWQAMKMHPVYGDEILREQGITGEAILDIVRHHHEKLPGSGYPDGLAGGAISQFVRISTIADVFDALTTRRPYKDALPSFQALRLMKNEMTADLDPELFRGFVEMMGNPKVQKSGEPL